MLQSNYIEYIDYYCSHVMHPAHPVPNFKYIIINHKRPQFGTCSSTTHLLGSTIMWMMLLTFRGLDNTSITKKINLILEFFINLI